MNELTASFLAVPKRMPFEMSTRSLGVISYISWLIFSKLQDVRNLVVLYY